MTTVSIVIATLDRANSLEATLASLRHLQHDAFEVIVVNGPSTDHTEQVVGAHRDVRMLSNPERNLARSRNIGIEASAGDLVAFIDDDALPEFTWLRDLSASFTDAEVAGAGGPVLDETGMAFQYRYSAVNRLGQPTHRDRIVHPDHCFPGSFTVPYIQGTNMIFRRSALVSVGGFDETYEYFHDETDLCMRLVDAGLVIEQSDRGVVHHKSAASAVRGAGRIVTNWYPIVKNNTYFAHRHARGHRSSTEIDAACRAFGSAVVSEAGRCEVEGLVERGFAEATVQVVARALADGSAAALRRATTRCLTAPDRSIAPTRLPARRTVVICAARSADVDEVARIALAADVVVRVVEASGIQASVELEGETWRHRLAVPSDIAGALVHEVERIQSFAPVDAVITHRATGIRSSSAPVDIEALELPPGWIAGAPPLHIE